MKSYRLFTAALAEVNEGADFYATASGDRLAMRFLIEVERGLASVCEFPGLGTLHRRGPRLLPLRHFPYTLVYVDTPGGIDVLALAHHRRALGYWIDRLESKP